MIRPASESDIPAMLHLLHQLFTLEADFVFSGERQQRGLELLLAADNTARIMVAEDHGEVVGMATAQLVISTAEGGPSLLVEDLVVGPTRQNRGIGTALLTALAAWGADRGAGRMQLLADRTNSPALDFYRQKGWRETQLICLRKYSNREEAL
jgi:GNAT superfamily N-acetyltransferase